MATKKLIKWVLIIIVLISAAILYKTYNPGESQLFPKCPFKEVTGLKCPGCGSQRAVHYLLNFDLVNALKEHPILVLAIPYLILGAYFDLIEQPKPQTLRWRKLLFGRTAIFVILILIVGFWVLRNFI